MSSNSKRKETITPSVSPAKKKLSRRIRYNKNKKLKWEQEHAEKTCELEESIAPVASLDLVFDPSRHRTQCGTRRLCTSDKIHYLEKEWRSIPLCSSDLISSKETKTKHEILTRELLTEILIWESKFTNNNSFELFDIPSDFITLVTTDIINCVSESNEEAELRISNSSSITDKDKLIWVSFGRWLGMEEPIKRREQCCHGTWTRTLDGTGRDSPCPCPAFFMSRTFADII